MKSILIVDATCRESATIEYIDAWLADTGVSGGAVFRGFRKAKEGYEKPIRAMRLCERAMQDILKRYPVYSEGQGITVAPHDLRRTYARLLHDAGVPVVAIQQNLGYANLKRPSITSATSK